MDNILVEMYQHDNRISLRELNRAIDREFNLAAEIIRPLHKGSDYQKIIDDRILKFCFPVTISVLLALGMDKQSIHPIINHGIHQKSLGLDPFWGSTLVTRRMKFLLQK